MCIDVYVYWHSQWVGLTTIALLFVEVKVGDGVYYNFTVQWAQCTEWCTESDAPDSDPLLRLHLVPSSLRLLHPLGWSSLLCRSGFTSSLHPSGSVRLLHPLGWSSLLCRSGFTSSLHPSGSFIPSAAPLSSVAPASPHPFIPPAPSGSFIPSADPLSSVAPAPPHPFIPPAPSGSFIPSAAPLSSVALASPRPFIPPAPSSPRLILSPLSLRLHRFLPDSRLRVSSRHHYSFCSHSNFNGNFTSCLLR